MWMIFSTITIVFCFPVTSSATNEDEPFWPPSNISTLIDPKDGRINLALKPRLISTPRTGYWASYYELLITSLASDVKVDPKSSQLKRMVDAQQTLLQQPNRPQYSLYPQVLNMREIVRDVRSGKPLEEEPINDPPLKPIHFPKNVCQPDLDEWPDLIIVVESCLKCARERQHARETFMQPSLWPELTVRFVFSIAVPDKLWNDKIKSSIWLFAQLGVEHSKYDDMLIGGPYDPEMLQTWNRIQSFRWLALFCQERVPLYLFLNSDYSVAPRNLITFIRGLSRDSQLILNAGLRPKTLDVPRSGVNQVDLDEIPWKRYPEHYNDTAFFVGAELLMDASITMAFTRPHRNSAAYLGFVWAKLDYPSLHLPEVIKVNGSYYEICASSVALMSLLDRYMDWSSGFFLAP